MSENNKSLNWKQLIDFFNEIKWLYALCEETDPDLCTNLQPLNEFRAALDHLMRIVAIENLPEYSGKDASEEARKLTSHLRRAFFDVCDMLSMNYRNRIIDSLEIFSVETINSALPTYYSTIKPRLFKIDEEIAKLRTETRVNGEDEQEAVTAYSKIIEDLKNYHTMVIDAMPSLNEIHQKTTMKNLFTQWIIPIGGLLVGAAGLLPYIF